MIKILSGNQYIKQLLSRFQLYDGCICACMDATLLDFITWLINLDLIPFTNKSKASKYIHLLYSLIQFRENVRQIVLHLCAFLALQGLKTDLRGWKISQNNTDISKGELRCVINTVFLDGKVIVFIFFYFHPKSWGAGTGVLAPSPLLLRSYFLPTF